jgi:hypothetical protein
MLFKSNNLLGKEKIKNGKKELISKDGGILDKLIVLPIKL